MKNIDLAALKSRKPSKLGLLAAALLVTLVAGQSASAYPNVLRGYAGVVVYYSGPSRTVIVGRQVVVNGCTPEYPQPVTMAGTTSSYSEFRIYACGQVPSPSGGEV